MVPSHAFIIASTCFLTQRNHPCIYYKARPSYSTTIFSKVDVQNDGILHMQQQKRCVGAFHKQQQRQRLPRTNTSRSRLDIIRRVILEVSLVSTAVAVASIALFARIECKFVIANCLRWMTISAFLKLCIIQSHLTSIAALEKVNWFVSGCFHLLLDYPNNVTQSSIPVRIRQVQGDGSCLFQAIAAGDLFDQITNVQPLQSNVIHHSFKLRDLAVNTLKEGIANNTSIITTNGDTATVLSLVSNAASLYGLSCCNYLSEMQQVNVWGGGPEIVALAHCLRRQIVLLEATCSGFSSDEHDVIYLKEMTRFGPHSTSLNPIFILAANERFPKVNGKAKQNHYLAVFPHLN